MTNRVKRQTIAALLVHPRLLNLLSVRPTLKLSRIPLVKLDFAASKLFAKFQSFNPRKLCHLNKSPIQQASDTETPI